jgi:hypothetical protein
VKDRDTTMSELMTIVLDSTTSFEIIMSNITSYNYLPGDANMENGIWPPTVIGGDVTYLVGWFRGINGSYFVGGFYNSADANGGCSIIGSDVTRLVSFFSGTAAISHCADYPTAWPPLPDEMPSDWPNCEVAR